jgi:hypothetical protein
LNQYEKYKESKESEERNNFIARDSCYPEVIVKGKLLLRNYPSNFLLNGL